jgi:H+/gluconate symporter-like permease
MAITLFRDADIPRRLMPAAIALGSMTFTMTALPGTPAVQNAIPMPFFGTTPFAAPGLGIIASIVMLAFGLWWLARAESSARRKGEGFASRAIEGMPERPLADDEFLRERATASHEFDTAELSHGKHSESVPSPLVAAIPIVAVVLVNLLMSFFVLPRMDFSFLGQERWGSTSLSAVAGVWSAAVALAAGIRALLILNFRRLPSIRESMDSGANASVLPLLTLASLVGFGAVVAVLPALAVVREWVLSIGGGPLVSLAVATNILAALTGSASGGLSIALDALAETYMRIAADQAIDPALLHRVAVIGSGTLDSLPHNGAVVTLLAVCGSNHKESYFDMVMVAIVGAIVSLAVVIVLGTLFGSF